MRGISLIKRIGLVIIVLITFIAGVLVVCACLPPPKGIPVLEYHMVSEATDDESRSYSVPPEEFAKELDYLAAEGYTTISMLDFMKARKGKAELPEKPVILTFDDGYEDNYDVLLPMLEERGMKATVYMITNNIGKKGYLTWDELRDMQERGIEIGSHTANHLPLPTLTEDQVQDELYLSKLLLEWNGIKTVFTFSYPNGEYTEAIAARVKNNEYLTAVTGDSGLNTFATDPYQMQRINVSHPHFGILEFRWRLFKAEVMTRFGIFQHKDKARESAEG